jgi:hypothetical protein
VVVQKWHELASLKREVREVGKQIRVPNGPFDCVLRLSMLMSSLMKSVNSY